MGRARRRRKRTYRPRLSSEDRDSQQGRTESGLCLPFIAQSEWTRKINKHKNTKNNGKSQKKKENVPTVSFH